MCLCSQAPAQARPACWFTALPILSAESEKTRAASWRSHTTATRQSNIRRRLAELIGDDSRGVTVLTCHALAIAAGRGEFLWADGAS